MSYLTAKIAGIYTSHHARKIVRLVKFRSRLTYTHLKFNLGMRIYDLGKVIGKIPRGKFPLKIKLAIIKTEYLICLLGIRIS